MREGGTVVCVKSKKVVIPSDIHLGCGYLQ